MRRLLLIAGFFSACSILHADGMQVANWPSKFNCTGSTVAVSGTVSIGNFPSVQPVSGTFWPTTQPISGTVSIQSSTTTNVTVQNFTITGSTKTDQSVASYTVPAGVTFYLTYAEAESYYLTFTTLTSNFGVAYFSVNGIHAYTTQMAGSGISRTGFLQFNPPLVYPAGTAITWLVTPALATATVWYGNLGGYYK